MQDLLNKKQRVQMRKTVKTSSAPQHQKEKKRKVKEGKRNKLHLLVMIAERVWKTKF